MEHLIALLPLLSSQPFLQAVVGVVGLVLCTFMVVRANKDKQALPPPAAGSITDVPQPFMQGPREVIDIIHEQRDMDRRRTEDSSAIRDCARIIRDEAKKQTEILERMAEDDRVERRVLAERHAHP